MNKNENTSGDDVGSAPLMQENINKLYPFSALSHSSFGHSKTEGDELESEFQNQKKRKSKSLPLQRAATPPKPYPFSALGPILGPVAKRIHEVVKAPDSICGNSVLAAAAFLLQPYADIHIDGRVHPLSLFLLTVAESGDRKSAVDNIILKAVRDYESMLKKTSDTDKRLYKDKIEIWKKEREQILKDGGSDLEKDLSNKPEPRRPLEPHLLLEEPTYEGLIKLFAVGQPSTGLFSDEGGRMLGGYSMSEENMLKTACGLSNLWDGKQITRIRGEDDNLLLYGRRLSMHLMIQDVVLSSVLKNEVLVGQGLLARCLIVAPQTNAGERPYNPVDISKDPIIVDFWRRCSQILDNPYPLISPDVPNELRPHPLILSPSAKDRWIPFHDAIDQALKPEGNYYSIRRTANKAAEQVLRIAGILTLIHNFEAENLELEAIELAIQLVQFYLDESLRIGEVSLSDPDLELAQKVLSWMKKKAANEAKVFSLQEIYHDAGPRAVRNKKTAQKIMGILTDHRLIDRPDPKKEEWILIPD